jgi:hypothetical protein
MADRDHLEREIEEILGKIEDFPAAEPRYKRGSRRVLRRFGSAVSERQRAVMRFMSRISVSQVMLISFLMILGAFILLRRNPMLMNWVMWAGIILFVSSFAILVFSRGRGSGGGDSETRWRGRSVEYEAGPSIVQRVRLWLSGRARR